MASDIYNLLQTLNGILATDDHRVGALVLEIGMESSNKLEITIDEELVRKISLGDRAGSKELSKMEEESLSADRQRFLDSSKEPVNIIL